MFEFNADGSLKLPGFIAQKKEMDAEKMRGSRCIEIRRELISSYSPKKCKLHIRLSDSMQDNSFVENLYKYFQNESEVPTKIIKITEKEFEIEIGTCFSRCRDCNVLVNKYREVMDGNMIEHKGTCTFEHRNNFCYEDHFE